MFRSILAFAILSSALARVYQGELTGKTGFTYLGKFVFEFDVRNTDAHPIIIGSVKLTVDNDGQPIDPSNNDLALYLYDDGDAASGESYSWNTVYSQPDLNCTQKLSYSKGIIPLKLSTNSSLCEQNSKTTPCLYALQTISEGVRPRFWYAVLAHSKDCTVPVVVPNFRIDFMNYINGIESQISCDEYGITPFYIIAFIIWMILLIMHLIAYCRDPINNPSIKLFSLSLAVMTAALGFHAIHWISYSSNGTGVPGLDDFADVLVGISTVLYWFMIAFISQGYGISKALLSENSGTKQIGGIMIGCFGIGYLAMSLWYYLGRNEAVTEYIYDTPAGIIVLIIQLLYAAWSLHNLYKTFNQEDGNLKRNWYIACVWVFGFFFGTTPIIAIVATIVSPWVQFGVCVMAVTAVNTLVFGFTVLLLFPSLASEVFKISNKGRNFGDDSSGYANL